MQTSDNMTTDIDRDFRLSSYQGEDKIIPVATKIEQQRHHSKSVQSFKSGLPTLQKILEGYRVGELIVISGITGHGKSVFCKTEAFHLASQGVFPLLFSFEVPENQLFEGVDADALKYIEAPAKMQENSLQWIEERLIESHLKYGSRVAVIDHLSYLVGMNPGNNLSYQIGEIVKGLKQLALKHQYVVFLVAHMQKVQPDVEPGLGHVRDSSFTEQFADTILYLWRTRQDKMITALKVAKNRRRGVIDETIALTVKDGLFTELSKYDLNGMGGTR